MREARLPLLLSSVLFLLVAVGCTNRPPVLNCMVDQATVVEGRRVTVDTNASDPENKPLSFDWIATSEVRPGGAGVEFSPRKVSAQNGSAVYDTSGLPPGRYTIRASVSDSKKANACQVHVVVEKNKQAPTVACNPSSLNVTEGQSRTVRASASDPNGDALSYSWSVDGQSASGDSASFEFGTTGRSVGAHSVRVTATDSDGMSASCEFSVNIDRRPNSNPTVSLSLDKSSAYAGDTIAATAQANDPDGDPLTHAWTVDGQSRPGGSSRLSINTSGLAGGRHSVSVTVSDDRGGTANATQSFSIQEKIILAINQVRPDNVAKAQLDEIALKMRQNPQLRATLTGHTDDRGSESGNERMGMRRADAVKAYLVDEQNIDAGRIETRSAGETQPRADNSTEQGRRDNRRVEVELFVP